MPQLARRPWVPRPTDELVEHIAAEVEGRASADTARWVEELATASSRIHDEECINLNPAANTMNPRAEALLASGLGSRPSLGYPGDKYEMGLEAVEQIETIAAELAAEVFRAPFAEVRVGSGALANLYTFMATCRPGDTVIVPPATIGGHVTHNRGGAADLYGLDIHEAPIDPRRYTVDVAGVRSLAAEVRPALISIGGSLNLTVHPVAALREIADEFGATLLFDAAHLSGLIAGGAWPNPLHEGAQVMTMSTYKSLAGPPAGLLVTTDAGIAERVDAIAFPGLTANFDAANTAALAITLTDWQTYGNAYAGDMVVAAQRLASELEGHGVDVHRPAGNERATSSHAFALRPSTGDGHATARRLRRSNLLTSAIGLPDDAAAGVRIGTNELVRWGMTAAHMPQLADLFARAWHDEAPTDALAAEVSSLRQRFRQVRYHG